MPRPDYMAQQDPSSEPTDAPQTASKDDTLGSVPGLYNLLRDRSEDSVVGNDGPQFSGDDLGLGSDPAFAVQDSAMLATPTFDEASSLDFAPKDTTKNLMSDLLMKAPQGDLSSGRAAVVSFARKMLGTPYVWGGTQMDGVDCSGLVLLALKQAGINAPRVSANQAGMGKRVALNDLKPGDLVAWDNSSRNHGADHIAIYIGNGQIIEAPRPGGVVQVSNLYDTDRAWGVSLGY